jgi:hypothetical protein
MYKVLFLFLNRMSDLISQTVYALALQVYLKPPDGKLLPSPYPLSNIDVEK